MNIFNLTSAGAVLKITRSSNKRFQYDKEGIENVTQIDATQKIKHEQTNWFEKQIGKLQDKSYKIKRRQQRIKQKIKKKWKK